MCIGNEKNCSCHLKECAVKYHDDRRTFREIDERLTEECNYMILDQIIQVNGDPNRPQNTDEQRGYIKALRWVMMKEQFEEVR